MARGINKVTLIGNMGDEPTVRYNQTGGAITSISVATSESWTDKQTNERNERTEWHKVVFFGKLAEIAGEYLHKGSKVYIEGSLRTSKWQTDDGQDRYTTEIIAKELEMLDTKGGAMDQAQQGYEAQQPQQRPQDRRAPRQQANGQRQQQAQQGEYIQKRQGQGQVPPPPQSGAWDDFADDVPFNSGDA